jgi:hypothetical protein
VFRVEAGQEIAATWNGTAMTERTLPAQEVGAGCGPSCVDWLPVAAGAYTFTATAWSACAGDCTCGEAGLPCSPPAGLAGTPDLSATATVTLPGATEVVVTFQ